jgi:hypothetical protein
VLVWGGDRGKQKPVRVLVSDSGPGGAFRREYLTKSYEVLAPARFVSGLISNDLAVGFLVANAALVAFGLWCWAVPVRSGWPTTRRLFPWRDHGSTAAAFRFVAGGSPDSAHRAARGCWGQQAMRLCLTLLSSAA